jgi:hypothetical protein
MVKVVTEKPKPKQPRTSTEKPSVWELGRLSVVQLGKRVWTALDSAAAAERVAPTPSLSASAKRLRRKTYNLSS